MWLMIRRFRPGSCNECFCNSRFHVTCYHQRSISMLFDFYISDYRLVLHSLRPLSGYGMSRSGLSWKQNPFFWWEHRVQHISWGALYLKFHRPNDSEFITTTYRSAKAGPCRKWIYEVINAAKLTRCDRARLGAEGGVGVRGSGWFDLIWFDH